MKDTLPPIITLTTDFGGQDHFVGVLKGVILGINPRAVLVDLCHEVPPQNVAHGAFVLYCAYRYFPPGAVHLAVIDPGVGLRERKIIAVHAAHQTFIGPDNGLFSYILDEEKEFKIHLVENSDWMPGAISRTFHGRDIMAPVAAHLSNGETLARAGREITEILRLQPLAARYGEDRIEGRVVHVDRFGNLVTNISTSRARKRFGVDFLMETGSLRIQGLSEAYAASRPGDVLAVGGSHGFIEIARYLGRAENPPHMTRGTQVVLKARS